MSTDTLAPDNGAEQLPMARFTERAYLEYSMYVILDRALPNIADGLKPVQRRIVYAMSELGLSASAKFKKSARTVGDVLGKFHPHGDSACYEAMVLMAQPFSYRYPLIDGQGNWGSLDDPKSFAAMRYTEARLAPYAETLLAELEQGTVDWGPNFDGTLEEPRLLPARLPNVLLNGGSGIAVGMATDIPPHNLREVTDACLRLLANPKTGLDELCEAITGPDYPTEAEIISSPADIKDIYRSGSGSVRLRARYDKEGGDVVITALPFQVSAARVLEQIAAQMNARKLPMVDDLRDESDHENPVRLVVATRSNRVDSDALMNHLFATTDLERSYRVNLNMIGLDGRPEVKNLRGVLTEWLEFRLATVKRRLEYRLQRVERRLHLLEGLLVAFLNLDEVIRIIREEDKPKTVLIQTFELSEVQADYILDTRLRQLARLEEMNIQAERDELAGEQKELQKILVSRKRLKSLVAKELKQDAERFGDARRSPIVRRAAAQALQESQLVPSEPVTVILSERGWARAGKGHELDARKLSFKSGDGYLQSARGRSNQPAVFLDSSGRSYVLAAHSLPSARGQGEPLSARLNPAQGADFVGVVMGEEDDLFLLASDTGYGFIVRLGDLITKNRSGKQVVNVPNTARLLPPVPLRSVEQDWVAVVGSSGNLLLLAAAEIPQLGRGKGVKLMAIPSKKAASGEDQVRVLAAVQEGEKLTVHAGQRHKRLKWSELEGYMGERGRRGAKLPQGFRKVHALSVDE